MKIIPYAIPEVSGGHVGASLGLKHRAPLDRILEEHDASAPVMVLLDLTAVSAATASYLKAVWLALVLTGAHAFRGAIKPITDGPPVRDLYPVLTGVNDELRHELDLIATAEQVLAIEVGKVARGQVRSVRVHGAPEASVRQTIFAMLQHGGPVSATQLHEAGSAAIAATGWNNRLNEVSRLRLAVRTKEGRQMLYQLIAPEVSLG